MSNDILSHVYYKDLFMQLLSVEGLAYKMNETRGITVDMQCCKLENVSVLVFLRERILTFSCQNIIDLTLQQKKIIFPLLNELNRDYSDVKFTVENDALCMTLRTFILKERMICQCLLILRHLQAVLDKIYPLLRHKLS